MPFGFCDRYGAWAHMSVIRLIGHTSAGVDQNLPYRFQAIAIASIICSVRGARFSVGWLMFDSPSVVCVAALG